METEIIYARVPAGLKAELDKYAAGHGLTMARALTRLLALGLHRPDGQELLAELDKRVGRIEEMLGAG